MGCFGREFECVEVFVLGDFESYGFLGWGMWYFLDRNLVEEL